MTHDERCIDRTTCEAMLDARDRVIREQAKEIAALRAARDKLQAFKDWVHDYLDRHGVPHHPPGTHGAAGCRIGDRMDWLMAEFENLRAALLPFGTAARDSRYLTVEPLTDDGELLCLGVKVCAWKRAAELTEATEPGGEKGRGRALDG